MYQNLLQAGITRPPRFRRLASYRDYTVRQREHVASLTLPSPQIKDWIEFAHDTDGDWPSFPLPLGDTWATNKGDFVTVELLDAAETESFDTVCREAGARFGGGVLACAALAERELTGTETYHGFTAYDTRTPDIDTMSVGWFASVFPVTVPTGNGSFAEVARAAQKSFDANKHLAGVPFERVLELAHRISWGSSCPRAGNDGVVHRLPQDPRRHTVGRDELRHLRRQSVARRDQHVGQPARRQKPP